MIAVNRSRRHWKALLLIVVAVLLALPRAGTEAAPTAEVKKLTASDAANDDRFGWRVAVSGDTAIVGAYYEDGAGVDRGAAYVFGRDQGGTKNWGEVTKLTASDAEDDDYFGYSVSLNGETAIVGADGEAGAGTARGAAYVFQSPSAPVTNTAELQEVDGASSETEASSGPSTGVVAGIAATVAACAVALAGAVWYVRRRAG